MLLYSCSYNKKSKPQKNKNMTNTVQIKEYFSPLQTKIIEKHKITSPEETRCEPPGSLGASGSKSFNDISN